VGLSFLDKMTDAGLEILAVGCAQLQALDLEQTLIIDCRSRSVAVYAIQSKNPTDFENGLSFAITYPKQRSKSEAKIVGCFQHFRFHTLSPTAAESAMRHGFGLAHG
jgi:hypothetical protein